MAAIIALVAVFAVFPRLGTLPLREWDEARVAESSYEMYKSGNPLVATFDWQADLWNTKPPLALWLQGLSIRLFGLSETTVRLPSAVAFVLSALFLFYFFARLKRPLAGFYSALVFVCCKGLLFYHCARSADYDALMILFCILYCGFFYLFLRLKENRYLVWFAVFLSLSVLTKGVQPLIPLAALFVWLLVERRFVSLLKNPYLYICIGVFVLSVGGFYLAREAAAPGYLRAVWENELGGRFLTVLEEHQGDAWYYFDYLSKTQMPYFFWLLPFAFVLNLVFKDRVLKRANLFFALLAVVYFVVITIAKTKLEWYSLPAIAFLAAVLGMALSQTHLFVHENTSLLFIRKEGNKQTAGSNGNGGALIHGVLFLICAAFFYSPYSEILNHNFLSKEEECNREYYSRVELMRRVAKGKTDARYSKIYFIDEERAQLDYFYYSLLRENGVENERKFLPTLQAGDTVQVNRGETHEQLQQKFDLDTLESQLTTHIVRLKDKTQHTNGHISNNTRLQRAGQRPTYARENE